MNTDRQRHPRQSVWNTLNIILLVDLNAIRWRFELSVVICECLRLKTF